MAASPGGVVVGRISVKVLPDTSEFRQDAKRALDKIEKQLDFTLKIELDTRGLDEQLQKIKDKLQDFKDKNDPLKFTIQLDMLAGQTSVISARLAYLTRPRTVPIIPVLSEGALMGVLSALGALSGARVLKDLLDNFKDIGKEMDRLAPRIGLVSLLLGGLSASFLATSSNAAALIVSIASIAGAFLALPGLIGGFAIGLGATISAFSDFKEMLPEVFDELSKINGLMKAEFWNAALGPFREMAEILLPLWSKGFEGVGTSMGGFFGALAAGFGQSLAPLMDSMFANFNAAIDIMAGAAPAIANIFSILSKAGTDVMPQLAESFAGVLTKFSDFLTLAAEDGSLNEWITNGFQALVDLGSSLASIGAIISAIGEAAAAAGGSGLGVLADTLNKVQAIVESPAFQETLTAVFEAAHDIMSKIGLQSGPAFYQLMKGLADTFVAIGPAIGNGIGAAFNAIFQAVSQPAVLEAVVALFNGMATAIVQLAPSLAPLMQAFAALVPVIVALLTTIAPLVTAALVPLSEIIIELAPALLPLISLLGEAFLTAVQLLAPLLVTVAGALADFIPPLVAGLAPILPIIVAAFGTLIDALMILLPVFLDLLTKVVIPLLPVFLMLAGTLLPVLADVILIVAEALAPLLEAFMQILDILLPVLLPVLMILITAFSVLLTGAIKIAGLVIVGVFKAIAGISQWLGEQVRPIFDAIGKWFSGLKDAIVKAGDKIVKFFEDLPQTISDFFANAKDWLKDAGKKIIDGLIAGIQSGFANVQEKLTALTDLLPDWKGPAERDATLLTDAGALVIDGFINGLESRYDAVRASLRSLTEDVEGTEIGAPKMGTAFEAALSGVASSNGKTLIYNAAPGNSLSSEEDLFAATDRGRMMGW